MLNTAILAKSFRDERKTEQMTGMVWTFVYVHSLEVLFSFVFVFFFSSGFFIYHQEEEDRTLQHLCSQGVRYQMRGVQGDERGVGRSLTTTVIASVVVNSSPPIVARV